MSGFFKSFVFPFVIHFTAYLIGLFYGIKFIYQLLKIIIQCKSLDVFKVKKRELPPECLNDPELGNHVYVQLKNIKVHYVEKGDKSKPLMLFLHGFPEFWYSWRYQIKEFSKDYWTVAVDLRGYGDSEKPKGVQYYHVKYLVQDLKDLLEILGKEKCILVAHDWGGIIAFYFMHNYSHLIDSYAILCSGHPKAFLQVICSSLHQFKKSWYVFFNQLPYLPEILFTMKDMNFFDKVFSTSKQITKEDLEAFKFIFKNQDGVTPAINYYRKNITIHHDLLQKHESNFQWPQGLFLYAEKDNYIDFDVVEKTKQIVNNLKIERIKDGSHFLQQDEPEKVNKSIYNFLKSNYKCRVQN